MTFATLNQTPTALAELKTLTLPDNHPLTQGLLKGIEKEGLRVQPNGDLSQILHPKGLGSALTHPHITTDFSEALLEFITAPTHLNQNLLSDLNHLHQYTYEHLHNEVVWPLSMPCKLPADEKIPVAVYGTSNRARMKTVYREGLGLRYGRTMQTVAGLHYNFSLPRSFWAYLHQQELTCQPLDAFTTDKYFGLIRNFRRYYWLLIYLFGASPAVDTSFVKNRPHTLSLISPNTYGLPYATALRMGDLGYQSSAQSSLFVCYNHLSTYTATLGQAIHTPYPAYQSIARNGLQQLNSSLLQIENEFYSPIRPKRTAHAGETALTALCNRGVEYLEVRCLDLDPFEPAGIAKDTLKFLDTFLLYCLLRPSPECDPLEFSSAGENQKRVVLEGRKPGLTLVMPNNQEQLLAIWAQGLLDDMQAVASMLDASHSNNSYSQALTNAQQKIKNPNLTPSAKIAAALTSNNMSHIEFGLIQAKLHQQQLSKTPLTPSLRKRYSDMAEESLQLLHNEEQHPQDSFDDYLADYYNQYKACCNQHK